MPQSPRFIASLLLLLVSSRLSASPATSLADACDRGDLKVVRTLVQQGADVNAHGVDGTSPLHHAVSSDHLDVADFLLKAHADVSAADRYGVTPLTLATLNGNASMIRRLLDAGADPNAADPAGETALMTAAQTGVPKRCRCSSTPGRAWTRAT